VEKMADLMNETEVSKFLGCEFGMRSALAAFWTWAKVQKGCPSRGLQSGSRVRMV